MDLLRIVTRLVPDVEWVGNAVDATSKQSLQETFYSPSGTPFPTNAEGIAAWAEIQAEDEAAAVAAAELEADMADIEKADTYLTAQITKLTTLTVPERVVLRDSLLKMFEYLIKRI